MMIIGHHHYIQAQVILLILIANTHYQESNLTETFAMQEWTS